MDLGGSQPKTKIGECDNGESHTIPSRVHHYFPLWSTLKVQREAPNQTSMAMAQILGPWGPHDGRGGKRSLVGSHMGQSYGAERSQSHTRSAFGKIKWASVGCGPMVSNLSVRTTGAIGATTSPPPRQRVPSLEPWMAPPKGGCMK